MLKRKQTEDNFTVSNTFVCLFVSLLAVDPIFQAFAAGTRLTPLTLSPTDLKRLLTSWICQTERLYVLSSLLSALFWPLQFVPFSFGSVTTNRSECERDL